MTTTKAQMITSIDYIGTLAPQLNAVNGAELTKRVNAAMVLAQGLPADPVTPPVAVAPVNTSIPTISGSLIVGSVLTATNGSWTSDTAITYARQWRADGADITGAISSTYTISSADVGKVITYRVIATNSAGSTTATSASTAPVVAATPPANTVLPVINGSLVVGNSLTGTTGTWTGTPTNYIYQWLANGTEIAGAISAGYTLTSAELAKTIAFRVIATNIGGSTTATSAVTTAVVPVAPANTSLPTISGTAMEGNTLTGANGTWTGSPTGYAYQWRANGVNITGASNPTYVLTAADVGKTITFRVTATNAGGSTVATSASTAAVTAAPVPTLPPANTSVPVISGTLVVGSVLTG
ncbi:MAG: hypothetical protein M3R04_07275, partial [bacterium]|nr:hypothetical protein [bacterium]